MKLMSKHPDYWINAARFAVHAQDYPAAREYLGCAFAAACDHQAYDLLPRILDATAQLEGRQ